MLNRDIMACAQTGSGKTAAYLLPILDDLMNQKIKAESADRQFPQVLIVTPTRELAIQIYEQCRMFAKNTGLMAQCLYGGTDVRFVRSVSLSLSNFYQHESSFVDDKKSKRISEVFKARCKL